jgi:hypothetical protein
MLQRGMVHDRTDTRHRSHIRAIDPLPRGTGGLPPITISISSGNGIHGKGEVSEAINSSLQIDPGASWPLPSPSHDGDNHDDYASADSERPTDGMSDRQHLRDSRFRFARNA